MRSAFRRRLQGYARQLKRAVNALVGFAAAGLLRLLRRTNPDRMANFAGTLMRRLGPWLPEHGTGRANLMAAFPEKSAAEIEAILAGVWDNLGRVAAEFAHLDRLWDYDPERPNTGRIEFTPRSMELFLRLRDDGKPALVFAAHLANWELPPLAASAYGMPAAVVYRRPNLGAVAEAIIPLRAVSMGELIPSDRGAPLRVARALEKGVHVGMLVDQHFGQGVDVTFFGRRCKANPLIAQLARHVECPIHGTRIVRRADDKNRFTIEMTPAIVPARDAQGLIDIAGTMQVITTVIEGWVREHPEQWLWLHRRWR
jgi:Kdo2-lipid IVA lauroyltransferase/acyltransferase